MPWAKRNVYSPPNFLRRRCRARFPIAFAADREGGSGTTRPRSSRQIELPPYPQRQGSDGGKRIMEGRAPSRPILGTAQRPIPHKFFCRKSLQSCGRFLPMYRRCGFRHERKLRATGVTRIAGIDEAGRGALAGPVVAAAVTLPEKFRHRRLNDSKQLAPELREEIYCELIGNPQISWAVGVIDSIEIDRINILRATHKAMRAALAALSIPPDHVLIDGLPVIQFPLPQTAIIDGDCFSLSIAAASVIAKVSRDAMMRDFCAHFPEYCFSQHKGYTTELHLLKLHEFGACPIHRRSFEPVAQPLLALERLLNAPTSPARCSRRETGLPIPAA